MATKQCASCPGDADAWAMSGETARVAVAWRLLGLSILMIAVSVALVATNGCLMTHHRFPYPAVLVLTNVGCCSSLAGVLRVCVPTLFPSLADRRDLPQINFRLVCYDVLPICLMSAASLVASNLAYEYLSVAFMQMLKETGIVYVYLMSAMLGSEQLSCAQLQAVILAVTFAMMSVQGELRFSAVGLAIHALGTAFESMRVALLGKFLSGKRWDVFTSVLVTSPVSVAVLICVLGIVAFLPASSALQFLAIPTRAKLQENWVLLFVGGGLSFSLQIIVVALVKHSSAMTFVYVQLFRDIFVVLMSAFLLHDTVTNLQCVSFALQLGAVLAWSLVKMYPAAFHGRDLTAGLVHLAASMCETSGRKHIV